MFSPLPSGVCSLRVTLQRERMQQLGIAPVDDAHSKPETCRRVPLQGDGIVVGRSRRQVPASFNLAATRNPLAWATSSRSTSLTCPCHSLTGAAP